MSEKKYLLIYWRHITDHLKADIKMLNNLTSGEVVEFLSSGDDEFEFKLFEQSDEITGFEYEAFAANAKILRDLNEL